MDAEEQAKLIHARAFILEARRLGLIDRDTFRRLADHLDDRRSALNADEEQLLARQAAGAVAPPRPVPPPPIPPPPGRPAGHARPVPPAAPPTRPSAPASHRPVPRPSPPRRPPEPRRDLISPWLERTRRLRGLVASDFGLHGLAYLGVLLTFAGTFGFIFFAFSELQPATRPIAEIAIPIVFFGWAWFLRRQRAPLVALGLEALGGAVLPLVVFASFVDGVAPEATGPALIAGLTLGSLFLAVGYAAWTGRSPTSPLRYLVAPLAWTAAMAAAFAFKPGPLAGGAAIKAPVAAQMATGAVAIAVTVLAARLRPNHPLVRPSRIASVPGIAFVYLITILIAGNEQWPTAPLVVAGVAVLVWTEALGPGRAATTVFHLAQALILAVTLAPLSQSLGTARFGLVTAIAYIGLVEWQGRRERQSIALLLPVAGVGVGLGMSLAAPGTAVLAWSVSSVWAHARRITGLRGAGERSWPTAAAAVLPVGAAYGMIAALPEGQGWMVVSSSLAAVALAVRLRHSDDPFWAWWIPSVGAAAAAGVAVTWLARLQTSPASLAAAGGLAGLALAMAPRRPALKVWTAAGAFTLMLHLAFEAGGLSSSMRPPAWEIAAALVVGGAFAWKRHPAGHIHAVGALAGSAALLAPSSGRASVVVLGAWTIGWLLTVISDLGTGAPLTTLLLRAGQDLSPRARRFAERAAAALPGLALATSLPFLVLAASDLSDVFHLNRSWSGVALAITAVAYSVAARSLTGRRPIGPILATGAVALSAVASAVAAPTPWPSIEAAAAAIGVVALMGGTLRRPAMTWFAWIMSGVLVVLLANRAGVGAHSLNLVSLAWGAVLLVGGLAFDDIRAGRRSPGEGLRVRWLSAPVALGALAVALSLGPVFTFGRIEFGYWMLGASVLYLAVAFQLRVGVVAGVAYALAAAGLTALLPWSPLSRPWIFAPLAGVLVALSWALGRAARTNDPWIRWDLAPLVVAHGVAAVALARSLDIGALTPTWVGFGVLSLAVATWRKHWAWAAGGVASILVGSAAASPGWLAVALAGTSAASLVGAVRTRGLTRSILRGLSLATAGWAWIETIVAAGWPRADAITATALASGILALIVGLLVRFRRLSSEWLVGWGGLASLGIVAGASSSPNHIDSLLPAGGTALLAAGAALAARPGRWRWLIWATIVATAVAWAQVVPGAGWSAGQVVQATSLASGGLAVLVGAALRIDRTPRDWSLAWGALASAGIASAALLASSSDPLKPDPFEIVGMLPAFGTALYAAGVALAARSLGWTWLPGLAAVSAGWAWAEFVLGQRWTPTRSATATAMVSGVLAVSTSSALRLRKLSREWTIAWTGLATVGLVFAAGTATQADPAVTWPAVSAALGLFALAAAIGARPLELPWLRESTAVLALASGWALEYGLGVRVSHQVSAAAGAGLVATFGSVVLWKRNPRSHWLRPLAIFGITASFASIPLATAGLPDRGPLVAALLVTGAESAAAGITLRRVEPLYLSPILLCAGWIVFASEALTGNPQWFTAPAGLTLLVIVEIGRWGRRQAGLLPVTPELLVLELLGIAFLVGASLVQIFSESPAYGLLAVGLGAGLMGWGGYTRVRRRAAAGALISLLAVLLMLAAPIAGSIDEIRSAILWISLAAVGAILIVVTTLLEQGRAKVKAVAHRLSELMEGWE